jgi:hypothetical protein
VAAGQTDYDYVTDPPSSSRREGGSPDDVAVITRWLFSAVWIRQARNEVQALP